MTPNRSHLHWNSTWKVRKRSFTVTKPDHYVTYPKFDFDWLNITPRWNLIEIPSRLFTSFASVYFFSAGLIRLLSSIIGWMKIGRLLRNLSLISLNAWGHRCRSSTRSPFSKTLIIVFSSLETSVPFFLPKIHR